MMDEQLFETLLTTLCSDLTLESQRSPFQTSKQFENRIREYLQTSLNDRELSIDFDPHPQAFPDIAIGQLGIEVKFTIHDTWRSVANSVLETNRIKTIDKIYLVFGKMGGIPEVRWAVYDKSIVHVRTSHVPRFEVELSNRESLFDLMGVSYDEFRKSPMGEKMRLIRTYARQRLNPGERLWWLEDNPDSTHSLPIQARLYTKLPPEEKVRLRAEAVLLCPQVVDSGRSRDKYDDMVLYLLTYHGVICHQARDLFSAGSVANPDNDDTGGIYIERALRLIERHIIDAAYRLEDALFVEYWGESVAVEKRIGKWLQKADSFAHGWKPSESLFRSLSR